MPVRWIASDTVYANSFVYENVLIDAGVLPMAVEPYAAAIDTIVITHTHYDHIARLRDRAALRGCSHLCPRGGRARPHRRRPEPLDALWGPFAGIAPDVLLHDGDRVGDLRVVHTPGHTPGGICLYSEAERLLFSGDTVFTGGSFGRYDFPGGDRTALAASIERLAALEVEGLYPGHGEPVLRGGGRHIAAAREALRYYG